MYKVSVIVPIYNVEKFISRCARALFEQTLDEIEYIFVNDCTPDNSVQVLQTVMQEYPTRCKDVKIVNHVHNRGLAAARNSGREVATGNYIICCDSDDWPEKNMYELLYSEAISSQTDIVVCDWQEIYPDRIERVYTPNITSPHSCVAAVLSGNMHSSVCNKLVRRSLYADYNISCLESMNFCEDLYVMYRLFYYAKSVSYVNKALYNYFKGNEDSYTSTKLSEQSQKGLLQLIRDVDLFVAYNTIVDNIICDAVCFMKVNMKLSILRFGSKKNAMLVPNVKLKYIANHPVLPFSYKILAFFVHLHCSSFVCLIWKLSSWLHSFRK